MVSSKLKKIILLCLISFTVLTVLTVFYFHRKEIFLNEISLKFKIKNLNDGFYIPKPFGEKIIFHSRAAYDLFARLHEPETQIGGLKFLAYPSDGTVVVARF